MVQYSHNAPYYELHLSELEDDAVRVLAFEGVESISRLFKYSFHLLSEDAELKAEDILNKKATFIMNRGDEDPLTICGIISRFEQRGQSPDYVSYYAELVPKMWRLGLTFQSRVFQNMDIEKIVTEVLEKSEFSSDDFEFQLNETYPELEFAVQYRESDFDFINRRLEHFGIYYYFDFRDDNDVVVFTDSNENLPQIDTGDDVLYNPNKDPLSEIETVSQFIYQGQVVTGKTQLKDYNYREPSKDLLSESELDSENRPGTYYNYGDHYKDETEGQFLARIRNEEIICNSVNYKGKSDCRLFRAGYKFTLGEHFREDWNTDYLLIHVLTRGNQRGLFGILQPSGKIEPTYENYFKALPPDIIFRPRRLTQHPKIHGILNAKVDATNDGEQAEIDDQGRYKVVLPFDLSGNSDGEASHYIRMIQPYTGPNYGTHFPLHKGTEVLLTFIDGNPDRPIISGAVPNPETISPVTNVNQTKSVIRDNYGNEIVLDATPGDEHIRLYSPHHESGLALGRSGEFWTKSDNVGFSGGNTYAAGIGNKGDYYLGNFSEVLVGSFQSMVIGLASIWTFGAGTAIKIGLDYEYAMTDKFSAIDGHKKEQAKKDMFNYAGTDQVIGAGSQICLAAGASEDNTERSLINIYPGRIMLTSGGGNIIHKDSAGKTYAEETQLWEDQLKGQSKAAYSATLGVAIISCILGFATPMVVEHASRKTQILEEDGRHTGEYDYGDFWNYFSTITGGLYGGLNIIYAAILSAIFGVKALKERKQPTEFVEPVEHTDPCGIIGLINKGIVLGLNPKQKQNGKIDMDSTMDSAIVLDSSGMISLRAFKGEKKIIQLASGEDGAINAKLKLTDKNIEMESGEAKVTISKSGDIFINNKSASQKIRIVSEGSIALDAGPKIEFLAQQVSAPKGLFESKNIKDIG
jgi:type VI secretion system secreted protein VgrG